MVEILTHAIYRRCGYKPNLESFVMLFNAFLDDGTTDQHSDYAIVAGIVLRWEGVPTLEKVWGNFIAKRRVSHFHALEFHDRTGDFEGWGSLKAQRFYDKLDKIIVKPCGRFSVAIDKKAHEELKRKMKGVKGYMPNSNTGLGFRIAMDYICRSIKIHPDPKVSFIIEDGPWTGDALNTYNRILATVNNRRGSNKAHMFEGFFLFQKRK